MAAPNALTLRRVIRASLLALALAALAVPAGAFARVPRGFVGMMADGPVFPPVDGSAELGAQLDKMVASGVENVRVVFDWSAAQPYQSWSDVPPADASQFTDVGGIPTRFGPLDEIVGDAAQRGLTVLPVVLYAPSWDAAPHPPGSFAPPAENTAYAAFLSALVHRYGPHGTFWSGRTHSAPITMWQVWNEPNIYTFWPKRPLASTYVALLRASHHAIKAADPRAKVVLAGMPNYSWLQLRSIYAVRGARRLFDVVAIHPYTSAPQGVITILKRVRNVMDQAGDRAKPILADEISWPSARGRGGHYSGFDIATSEAGQANKLAQLLPMLGKQRNRLGLLGFDYYTWAGVERRGGYPFDFAGLFRYSGGSFIAKPAYFAFRQAALALEGCKLKGSTATACLRRG